MGGAPRIIRRVISKPKPPPPASKGNLVPWKLTILLEKNSLIISFVNINLAPRLTKIVFLTFTLLFTKFLNLLSNLLKTLKSISSFINFDWWGLVIITVFKFSDLLILINSKKTSLWPMKTTDFKFSI